MFLSSVKNSLTQIDLPKRYGNNSWALITGSTNGIGKAWAFELASRGFNIVLVSRTEQVLKSVAQEIETKQHVKVRWMEKDFSNGQEVTFQDDFKKFDDIEISILVNNVGILEICSYHKISPKRMLDMTNINCHSQAILSRIFIERFMKRKDKSAIITMSSIASVNPSPIMSLQSATKSFNQFLSEGLNGEYGHKIDFLACRPAFVTTPMTNQKQGPFVITPEKCVGSMIHNLGKNSKSFGSWEHQLIAIVFDQMPSKESSPDTEEEMLKIYNIPKK